MLKGLTGFVVGAISGLLMAIGIARKIGPPDWAKEDFTGIMVIIFALFVIVGAGLAMLLFGIVGMLLAMHYL